MPITTDQITIAGFSDLYQKIVHDKEKVGIKAVHRNLDDLLERAKPYGIRYRNGSWGWCSNIWHRSAAQSVVVDSEADLRPEHKKLMLAVLEHMLCRPMIQVDRNLGAPSSPAKMRSRLYCDPQFPDIAYRWGELNFPGEPAEEPDAVLFVVPHYLNNPNVPGKDEMLRVIRFPNHGYSIVTVSSYQGEVKKGFLSHWVCHAYRRGGTGEHASLKEFTVKRTDGSKKRIVMCTWGLTGSGKSTHGMYVVDDRINKHFVDNFGVNLIEFVSDQAIKNDDIVGVFQDGVYSPERGSWTKTEDVDENQVAMWNAGKSPNALHENTEWDGKGDVSFEGKLFQHCGQLNRNARSVFRLEDTGHFDGSVDSSQPLNFAVFISPGDLADFAWLKLNDPDFAAKVLADGRTVGHPAQSLVGVGKTKYQSRYCLPFTMGVDSADHVHRFHSYLAERHGTADPIEVYQLNTTGSVGCKYQWTEAELGGTKVRTPAVLFEERNGRRRPVGGTGPSIEETELFIHQAARGVVEYEPHPLWGEKVLVPAKVPGLSDERLRQLNPFSYRSMDEMKELLNAQIESSKYYLSIQCEGLDEKILNSMSF
jgi:phosphoenolpyruvate carboxykinase (ATP)